MTEYPVTAQTAAKRLGVSLPTLNRWLLGRFLRSEPALAAGVDLVVN